MFTLIYHNGQFNRPDTLLSFLQSNVGKDALIQIDCITPFVGTKEQMELEVCYYLSKVDSEIKVKHKMTQNCSAEFTTRGELVKYLVMWIQVTGIKC